MKKIFASLIIIVFLTSCGPKRMSCYGKRCVETIKKSAPQNYQETKRNS